VEEAPGAQERIGPVTRGMRQGFTNS
jgi:hypothetical protein